MADFKIKLAGISFLAHTVFDYPEEYCRDYLTEEAPDIEITTDENDIQSERRLYMRQAGNNAGICPGDRYLETLALQRKVSDALIFNDALLLHGCAVAVEGKAYIFTAKSGTGKTTHCRLWLDYIKGSHILNGDKPFILFKGERVYVCGSPWQGKERWGVNEALPLGGICILKRGAANHIEHISFKAAFPTLFTQVYMPVNSDSRKRAMELLGRLEKAELFQLECNMKPEAAMISYAAMSGRKQ